MNESITVLNWNLEKGINLEAGARWVKEQRPDIFFQQEVQPDQLARVSDLLDMDGHIAVPRPGSSNDNAIFVRRDGPLVCTEEYPQAWAPWHAPANIAVRLRDPDGTLSPRQISAVSMHTCYWSPEHRLTEGRWCTTLAKPGWLAMVFGDWNSYRVGTDIRWDDYTDHAFVANRTYEYDGRRHTDMRPDRELLAAGYVEMARHAAEHLDQPEALAPSSGYRDHPGRPSGPRHCIDRGYLSAELAPALTSFTVCDTPQLRQLSDHLPLRAEFDFAQMRTVLHRTPAMYQPHDNRHAAPVHGHHPAAAGGAA
ncbi:endonuclease/exonuclease/phosphatase family protein [Streptomyces sp. NPDC005918]|uniref:endonuclease/exonuclease/phosphatase family protein n=1 Tax=Streptomyces sp. NPDC005918 TaxID=3155454 RepID=UPI0034112185